MSDNAHFTHCLPSWCKYSDNDCPVSYAAAYRDLQESFVAHSDQSARIAELEAERDEWRDDYERQRDAGDEARSRIAELEEALRPFAKMSDALEVGAIPPRGVIFEHLKRGVTPVQLHSKDFTRARTALKETDQ